MTAGVVTSVVIHAVALIILGFLVLKGPTMNQALEIIGITGDPNDGLGEIELDSSMTLDTSEPDSGAMEFSDLSQLLPTTGASFESGDSIRGLPGGKGKGAGGTGDGDAMALPGVAIPKYAVTKGSFSAWTEPKDPIPGKSYEIVIQFRLPANVKTYKGSDLTGMVVGTDGYKQAIKFARTEAFPVTDGSVQVRIRVPGADRLVRDTIRIESKLLREKQMIEIEF